jgi:hypothetical protein
MGAASSMLNGHYRARLRTFSNLWIADAGALSKFHTVLTEDVFRSR